MFRSFARYLLLPTLVCLSLTAMADVTENFNSRKGVPIQKIRSALQSSCWTFQHFDVNANGWNPGIEGDGAMVSELGALSSMYTPVLSVPASLALSFEYVFSENFSGDDQRWIKLCLVNSSNEVVKVLEELQLIGMNATRSSRYSTVFSNLEPGEYRLMLQYGGSGGNSCIAIDALELSAPFKYPNGCNAAPRALRDRVEGMADRTATGSLLNNDRDANNEKLTAYLIKGSIHGKVVLNEDGSFRFTPNAGFKGNTTSFVYKICDEGSTSLCSENTTVHIQFPTMTMAPGLATFKGWYKFDGKVELDWTTTHASYAGRFEIERSIDGKNWNGTGAVDAANTRDYAYIDKLNRNVAARRDIYYRLKQVNADGSSITSRILVVRVYNTKTVDMISVTPNPAVNDIAVNVQLQEKGFVMMKVRDRSGNIVLRKGLHATRGASTFLIEGSSKLQPGPYILEVIVNSRERMLVKLVKE